MIFSLTETFIWQWIAIYSIHVTAVLYENIVRIQSNQVFDVLYCTCESHIKRQCMPMCFQIKTWEYLSKEKKWAILLSNLFERIGSVRKTKCSFLLRFANLLEHWSLLVPVGQQVKVSALVFVFLFLRTFCAGCVRSGYEMMQALHCVIRNYIVLQGEAIHFGFYSRVLLTFCVSVCPDCGFIEARSKRTTQIII